MKIVFEETDFRSLEIIEIARQFLFFLTDAIHVIVQDVRIAISSGWYRFAIVMEMNLNMNEINFSEFLPFYYFALSTTLGLWLAAHSIGVLLRLVRYG